MKVKAQLMFELIFGSLKSLSLQTELLESCEWNQDLADYVLEAISTAVNNSETPEEVLSNIDKRLVGVVDKRQLKVAKKIFEHEAKMIFTEIKSTGGIH